MTTLTIPELNIELDNDTDLKCFFITQKSHTNSYDDQALCLANREQVQLLINKLQEALASM